MGQMMEFSRPDGSRAPGYYAGVEGAQHAPGVVMLEEWWGITEYIRGTADRLNQRGYRVLVPDLFRGRVAATGDEANHQMQGLDFGDAASQDARGAAQYLKSSGSNKVAVLGFCMGGALALLAAMFVPEFDAAVSFYGYPPPEAGDTGSIRIPVQGHWALHDEFFGIARVDAIESTLKAAGTPHEFYRYDARHAFDNPNQPGRSGLGNHDPVAAAQAWSRVEAFLSRYLA
jgi:carboxymethylenebutenolidase